jgi:hypothetical protein
MRTTAPVKRNEVLLSVPESVWLTKEAVLAQDAGGAVYAGVKDMDPWIVLALSLMRGDSQQRGC